MVEKWFYRTAVRLAFVIEVIGIAGIIRSSAAMTTSRVGMWVIMV